MRYFSFLTVDLPLFCRCCCVPVPPCAPFPFQQQTTPPPNPIMNTVDLPAPRETHQRGAPRRGRGFRSAKQQNVRPGSRRVASPLAADGCRLVVVLPPAAVAAMTPACHQVCLFRTCVTKKTQVLYRTNPIFLRCMLGVKRSRWFRWRKTDSGMRVLLIVLDKCVA